MPRPPSPGIAAAVAQDAHNYATLVELGSDSTTIRLTDWSGNLVYFGNTYVPRALKWKGLEYGFEVQEKGIQFAVDNVDLAISALVATQDVDGLRAAIYTVVPGVANEWVEKLTGRVHLDSVGEELVHFSLTPASSRVRDEIRPRRTFGELCDWQFADPETCAFQIPLIAGELVNQTAGLVYATGNTIGFEGSVLHPRTELASIGDPGSFWASGFVTFTSGPAAGITSKIRSNDPAAPPGLGSIILDLKPPLTPLVGDTYTIRRGCNRTARVCGNRFNNLNMFAGFLNIPGRAVGGGY